MKAIDILYCLNYMGTTNESWQILKVPPTSDVMMPQTREWWNAMIGGAPDEMLPSGMYVLLFTNDESNVGIITDGKTDYYYNDFVKTGDGEVIYLYRLED